MPLIIVESPTKARTFNRILKIAKKDDYYVFATMGHVRDLPGNEMAIDFANQFKPSYQVIEKKKKVVAELKSLTKKHKEIILATDPDREGEAIGYHAAFILGLIKEDWPKAKVKGKEDLKRIVFHEITPKALNEALEKPEGLRFNLVAAQQARRILDRVVGYELSPLLWKKMGKNWLSAGRVQSVALRIIAEREKEIRKFKTEQYYQLFGFFMRSSSNSVASEAEANSAKQSNPSKNASSPAPRNDAERTKAKLVSKNGLSYEEKVTIKLFAGDYQYTRSSLIADKVENLKVDLLTDSYVVNDLKEDTVSKFPPPPHTTSLLSQDAFYRYGYSSKMTMRLAQDLYERGLITYHRTDSFNLSTQFVFKAKDYILESFGKDYILEKPRGYRTRSKMAQEAHEAIRPTKLDAKAAEKSDDKRITVNHKRLYSLIFNRAVATQMKEASIKNFTISLVGKKGYLFESQMQQILFPGFLKLLNPNFVEKIKEVPKVKKGDQLKLFELESVESQTKPPPRYNEASLIKILEEKGIGRPSTYAPIINLIQIKNYVEKDARHFLPTKLGEAISDYLSVSFADLFNLDFTAKMEGDLDNVADDKLDFIKLLQEFNTPFQKELKLRRADKAFIDVEEEIKEKCPKCGSALTVRFSRFGKFLACSGYPKCKFTKPFLYFVAGKICPKDGGKIAVRFTKTKKKFYGCENYPKCDYSAWKWNDVKELKSSSSP